MNNKLFRTIVDITIDFIKKLLIFDYYTINFKMPSSF